MKRAFLALSAAVALSACAEYPYGYYDVYGNYHYGYHPYGYYPYGYHPYVPYAYGYGHYGDAYYDGFYGPYRGGYWGDDGFYYFNSGGGGPYVRDEGHHFRHEPTRGFYGVHSHGGPYHH